MKILMGKGVLSWSASERRGDRYGAVMLMKEGMNSNSLKEGPVDLIETPNHGTFCKLSVKIIKNRESTHIGDFFHGFFPTKPNVGEVIELGEGYLFYDLDRFGYTHVGVKPKNGRETFWLKPENLYRAHEQSVQLFCETP